MGPASLAAIKKGHVYLDYDTKFAFAEVNAETVSWIVPKDSRKVIWIYCWKAPVKPYDNYLLIAQMNISSSIEPIREGVRKKMSLMSCASLLCNIFKAIF